MEQLIVNRGEFVFDTSISAKACCFYQISQKLFFIYNTHVDSAFMTALAYDFMFEATKEDKSED